MTRPREPIAIIGSGCRFPGGVQTPSKLWDLLASPRDLSARIPSDRFSAVGFHHTEKTHHGSSNVQDAYTLSEDIRQFDAQFFSIKPVEAEAIDPQHRLLLETVYEGLEAAGQSIERLQGSNTSVYVGVMNSDYNDMVIRDIDALPQYMATGTARSILSNRISYFFDWHGPSMTIDTACSSSLVALHEAVQSLRAGDASVAVAAGANLIIGPEFFVSTTSLGMLSPDGRSRMWDVDANGYARGDGFAAVILKPLSAALEDGDHVECVIRETGVNQDGKTKGITMPSSVAQAQLIRDTYAKAGLDPRKKEDRCQYFEAHGTGTPAGDPQEASAVSSAFFEPGTLRAAGDDPLYVGSIKTIIGHTEGTAGLAGVLKASLAMQHGKIPPNMLLNELSPSVKPFYDNLLIPTQVRPWPTLPKGTPRRTSVNSFGFGGTNAHAILESYSADTIASRNNSRLTLPFVFSANSERSLVGTLRSYSAYLNSNPSTDLRDLSWTLIRRSGLPLKSAFAASTTEDLTAKIQEALDKSEENGPVGIRTLASSKILGVFTGQGAQWPQMGRQLLLHSDIAKKSLAGLEASLRELPESDRPTWTIADELSKDAATSRLGEAALSQPLCTAVQVILVDHLRAAGVKFHAVIGHSSGEIAAAYVAGFLSAHDAIRVAYYRGFHAHLARGKNGETGSMLAVGASLAEAVELCNTPGFRGRVGAAASNSSSSVTLSGDADAVAEVKAKFDESKKFARALKVDTAYHSHHMLPCSDAYVRSLQACGVQVKTPPKDACTWFSSVNHGEQMTVRDELRDTYWRDNMVHTVLFSEAVGAALSSRGPFDLAIETGPHPALKGPASQTIQEATGSTMPYVGALKRGSDDMDSLADALGSVWCNLGDSAVDLVSYGAAVAKGVTYRLLKGLPTYIWDHDRRFWAESRKSKAIRNRKDPVHPLLGRKSPESTDDEIRWGNVLKPREIDWLPGHQLQGQTIFPAAGYIAMALEATMIWSREKPVQLVEILDFSIDRSLPFDDDATGAETLFTLSTSGVETKETAQANFKCYAALHKQSTDLALIASGNVRLTFGEPTPTVLPPSTTPPQNTVDVNVDRFYENLVELGYGYNGPFRALTSIRRKVGIASGTLLDPTSEPAGTNFLVHPATLDVSIQAIMAAYSYPGDGRLWTLHVPTQIKRITVNPLLCRSRPRTGSEFRFDTVANDFAPSDVRGDICLCRSDDGYSMIEVEDLKLIPLSAPTSANDCPMFSTNVWNVASPNADLAIGNRLNHVKGVPNHAWIALVARQIIHRYPHMKILQIGGGEETATAILRELGGHFSSYTFTDISSEVVEDAQRSLSNKYKNLVFEKLDIEADGADQGFGAANYDMIIASNIMNNIESPEKMLKNMRTILKAGAQLLLEEAISDQPKRFQSDSGRRVSAVEWNARLKATGFSGVDTTTRCDESRSKTSVFTSVAMDERVRYLQNPLLVSSSEPIESLVIIGGKTLVVTKLVENIEALLLAKTRRITLIDSLEDLDESSIPPMSSILSLTELDEPIFKGFSSERHAGLRSLFNRAKVVVWVTQGCRLHEPFSNMTVGFGRSLVLEVPHIRLQFVDIEPRKQFGAHNLASILLRFQAFCTWEKNGEHTGLLWSSEPELTIDDGLVKIPRLIPDAAKNERYNSTKRAIVKDLDPSESIVTVKRTGGSFALRHDFDTVRQTSTAQGDVMIQVSHSLSSSIKILNGCYLFPIVGHVLPEGTSVFSLSAKNSSIVHVPKTWTLAVDNLDGNEKETLLSACAQILAKVMSDVVPNNSSFLVHEPPPLLAAALQQEAKKRALHATFTTSSSVAEQPCIFVHAQETSRQIKASIPRDVAVYFDLSVATMFSQSLGQRIADLLPDMCVIEDVRAIIRSESLLPSSCSAAVAETVASVENPEFPPDRSANRRILPLNELASVEAPNVIDIIDWNTSQPAPISVEPIDSGRIFDKGKTYLLVGLTGDLGLSLCEWMIDHGAEYIVLTSRNPKRNEEWLHEVQKSGATVDFCAVDITNKNDLYRLHQELSTKFPPIAGVANGAMVLRDAPFFDSEFHDFDGVFKPKVTGTINLDEFFSSEIPLDFFILFSSGVAQIGNRGQTAYGAANMFMSALAAQRRQRGLAASVMNIGAIVDCGYMARELPLDVQKTMKRELGMWISERDVHRMFAEAIRSGRPHLGENLEITSALHVVDPKEAPKTNWFHNPRFGFLVRPDATDSDTESKTASVSIQARLQAAGNKEEAFEVLKGSFSSKIQEILQLDSGAEGSERMLDSAADELGLDSLIAVEVRSWFMDELYVDLPVLKILGGATMKELLEDAVEKLSAEMLSFNESAPEAREATSSGIQSNEGSKLSTEASPTRSSSTSGLTSGNATPGTEFSESPPDQFTSTDSKSNASKPALSRSLDTSYGQSRFWFLRLVLEDPTTFNITVAARIKGNLRIDDLSRAVQTIGQRHEALRTCFYADEYQNAAQGVMLSSTLQLEEKRISSDNEALQHYNDLKRHTYDLNRGQTMRIILLSQAPDLNHLLIGYHHINMDGASFGVLMTDLEKAYSHQALPSNVLQYPDFTTRQLHNVQNGKLESELKYWREEFVTIPSPIPLFPLSKKSSRRPLQNYDFVRLDLKLEAAVNAKVKRAALKCKVSPFHFFLAVLKTMLFRFVDTDDLCIGIADANRVDSDTMNSIGMYLNVLPLRFRSKSQTFAESAKEAKEKAQGALIHSRLPFDVLLDELDVPRSSTHSPLFQVFVDYRAGQSETSSFSNCQIEYTDFSLGRTAYDLVLDVMETSDGGVRLMFKLQSYLYTEEDGKILANSFKSLLEAFANDTLLNVDAPAVYSPADVQNAIKAGHGRHMESDWPETIPHRIDQIIEQNMTKTAIKDGNGSALNYGQMAERVNAIAAILVDKGAEGKRIAVFQEPTSDWICSMLAIMRIGAVYVPLDLRNPFARLASIVKNAQPAIILAHAATTKDVSALDANEAAVVDISRIPGSAADKVPNRAVPDSPAVILYTSGSTGTPKGILLKHSSLRNEMEGYTQTWDIGPEVVLQQSAYSFDFSLDQMFTGLTAGGCIYVVPKSKRGDSVEIAKLIASEGITYTKATPSEYSSWIRYGSESLAQNLGWKFAFGGGETLTKELQADFRRLAKPGLRLLNSWGPAEVTISATKIEIPYADNDHDEAPVGFPLPNYALYIVDKDLHPVPVGVTGEVIVGGAGPAYGYVDNDALTKQKFLPNPFAADEHHSRGWRTMYRTGDRGRLTSNGALVFDGRIDGDTQVKLRGLRIELEDIESSIITAAAGALVKAVVSVRGEAQAQYLVAFVEFADKPLIGEKEQYLKRLLAQLPLPQYMCPALLVPVDQMPLNNHAKIDRLAIQSLPLPPSDAPTAFQAELTKTETKLKSIWDDVLTPELTALFTIDGSTDFFQIGGNSMLLVRLQSAIRTSFNVSLPLVQLLESTTLGDMTTRIEASAPSHALDWEAVTSLRDLYSPQLPDVVPMHPTKGRTILLTGASGHLGHALLASLDSDEAISRIHVIAVRSSYPPPSPKFVIHEGDLTAPRLGLSSRTFAILAATVDLVIHSGAKRAFFEDYEHLESTNVLATKEIIALATPRKVPIHFLSSGAVTTLDEKRELAPDASIESIRPPADGSNGYIASKWAGEALLEHAARERSIPISIHRLFGLRSSEIASKGDEILLDIKRFSEKERVLPLDNGWAGRLDFAPVDAVARSVRAAPAGTKPTISIMTYDADVRIEVGAVTDYLNKEISGKEGYERLDPLKWMGRIKKAGFGWLIMGQDIWRTDGDVCVRSSR